ncbi:tetraacyldisaccharide 4'-kinase [Emticicia sp. SJ17W-69]|uniref:tetraacyldisaccharide 4'-kinase n=1 Tax=Emticicia sp. SJ17W-69 TaxID=3421657 RepID=UPI003EC0F490
MLTLIIFLRNWLYDKKILKSTKPDVFCINVGNLNLGGTGKTPHVEYLVRLLSDNYKTTILSRGYKRKTKGFIRANMESTAQTIGDEPMQYYMKFGEKINVVVCENRVAGVREIQKQIPNNQIVILDDAFQHRKIAPQLNLLLCDYNRPFYTDSLVPFGKLRDLRQSAKRANAVIVTKCPKNISSQKYTEIFAGIKKYILSETPIFFSRISYQSLLGYSPKNNFKPEQKSNIVTAIAKPEVFEKYLLEQGLSIDFVHDFPDHFSFSRKEIDGIIKKTVQFKEVSQIITTEKDMVKIKPLLNEEEMKYFFYVPIEIELEDKKAFDDFIYKHLKDLP